MSHAPLWTISDTARARGENAFIMYHPNSRMQRSIGASLSLRLYAKGAIIGVANIIPGVSGGTLAVVLGIYDQLVAAISNLFTLSDMPRKGIVLFLAQLAAGACTSVFLLSNVIDYLYTSHMHPTVFFFIGLIIGSIPSVMRQHTDMRPSASNVALLFIGILAILSLSLVDAGESTEAESSTGAGLALLFVAGVAGAAAMIVPGFSGSFVLVAMGVYWTLIDAVRALDILTLIPSVLGGILGIGVVSKCLDRLLKAYPSQFYYCILGLIVASIYELYPGIPPGVAAAGCAVAAGAGAMISYFMST